jgi:hypothetical protein
MTVDRQKHDLKQEITRLFLRSKDMLKIKVFFPVLPELTGWFLFKCCFIAASAGTKIAVKHIKAIYGST